MERAALSTPLVEIYVWTVVMEANKGAPVQEIFHNIPDVFRVLSGHLHVQRRKDQRRQVVFADVGCSARGSSVSSMQNQEVALLIYSSRNTSCLCVWRKTALMDSGAPWNFQRGLFGKLFSRRISY